MRRRRRRHLRGGRPGGGAAGQLKTRSRTKPATAGVTSPRLVVALPGEPAGTLAPRVAGEAEIRATLAWRSPEDVSREPAFVPQPGPARFSLAEHNGPEDATRRISGEITALTQAELGAALEAALRGVTAFATLTEATLEVSVVRTIPPRIASPRALEALARDLWEAGFPVRFGPAWTPAPYAEAYLGVGGLEDLREFLQAHPAWSLA